jgi:HK97 gp10 family phage protein
VSLDITNKGEWVRGVSGALVDLELDSEESVTTLGADMAKLMRRSAPVQPDEQRRRRQAQPKGRESVRRRPGKTTIRSRKGRDGRGFFVDVGPSKAAFYLAFVEWGTSKMAAKPFLRPAIEQAISRWR